MSLSIPSDIFDIYNDAVDNIWSKPITLYYPEKRETCPNCLNDGVRSNGVYRTGGPAPFDYGFICPYCNGDGFKFIESSEIINARIYYNAKYWINVGDVNIANSAAQTVCKITDLPKIQRCKYIVPSYYDGIENFQAQKLFRLNDYFPEGFTQNSVKYVITFWGANNDKK